MRLILALTCSLVVASEGLAQTLVGAFNLAALGYSHASIRAVEADGDPGTVELLAVRHSDGLYSVGAVRASSCAGAWFNPRAGLPVSLWSSVSVERVAGRDVLVVRDAMAPATAYVIALHVPSC